jgi:hypothetical protein
MIRKTKLVNRGTGVGIREWVFDETCMIDINENVE